MIDLTDQCRVRLLIARQRLLLLFEQALGAVDPVLLRRDPLLNQFRATARSHAGLSFGGPQEFLHTRYRNRIAGMVKPS